MPVQIVLGFDSPAPGDVAVDCTQKEGQTLESFDGTLDTKAEHHPGLTMATKTRWGGHFFTFHAAALQSAPAASISINQIFCF